jgi:hypothetical protein
MKRTVETLHEASAARIKSSGETTVRDDALVACGQAFDIDFGRHRYFFF